MPCIYELPGWWHTVLQTSVAALQRLYNNSSTAFAAVSAMLPSGSALA
jgi:hypothetical protein